MEDKEIVSHTQMFTKKYVKVGDCIKILKFRGKKFEIKILGCTAKPWWTRSSTLFIVISLLLNLE